MKISATGPGRRGSIDQDVGKLVLYGAKDGEARRLAVLHDEMRGGNLGFWAPLMWAAQEGRISKSDMARLERIVERVGDDFTDYLRG